MFEKVKNEFGLKRWEYDLIETDNSSVFGAVFPSEFGLGKNRFTLAISANTLQKGTDVFIDIIDSNGKPVYFEISSIANDDNTRNVVVYVYESTAIGNCSIYIAGTRKRSGNAILVGNADYLYKKIVKINSKVPTQSPLVFKNTPIVTYTERLQPVSVSSNTNRLVVVNNLSGSISTGGNVVIPRQLYDSKFDIEKRDTQPQITDFNAEGMNQIQTKSVEVPSQFDSATIQAVNFEFSSSMRGGMIEIGSINVPFPKNAVDTASFYNLRYSASIVEVVNTGSIKVYPPFHQVINYTDSSGNSNTFFAERFSSIANFTCSYYDYADTTLTATTQSFVTLNISAIEPEFGQCKSIEVSYKAVNTFGDFKPIGAFENLPINLLADDSKVMADNISGLVPKSIGTFRNSSADDEFNDFRKYWVITGGGGFVDNRSLQNSIFVSGSTDFYLTPRSSYAIQTPKNTEYILTFKTKNAGRNNLTVLISGSAQIESLGNNGNITSLSSTARDLGTVVGSVSSKDSIEKKSEFYFKSSTQGSVTPIFLFDTGSWNISDISITPANRNGFTGNQTKLQIPIENVDTRTELLLKIKYLGGNGEYASKETLLTGVVFEGNKPEIVYPSASFSKYSDGYSTTMQHYRDVQFNNSGTDVLTVSFPIFKNRDNEPYTGSVYNVACAFTVETVVFGKTGSLAIPSDTYCWAGTLQCRGMVTKFDNLGKPLLFKTVAHSGSSVNQIGTFGSGPIFKTNLDSWFKLDRMSVVDGDLSIRYNLTSTSSFFWDAYGSSTLKATFFENRYN